MSEFLDSEIQVEGDTSDVDSIYCHESSEKELEIEIDDFEDSNKKINALKKTILNPKGLNSDNSLFVQFFMQ